MAGVLGIGGDLDRWTPAELAGAARLIGVYKDIRPLVRHGHRYPLLAPGDGALTAVQYVGPDADRTVVLVWRPCAFFGPAHPLLRLRGRPSRASACPSPPRRRATAPVRLRRVA
ncbi:hypothetical protein ACIG53_02770 [Streptomyces bauhiniae]|uniref:hypothetical protein n=1 Tax=Streptomyces bauhiniae TaxID=2340725 RepID=UPI0037D52135